MNALIVLGVLLSIIATSTAIYAIIGIVYYKFVLHSKKSLFDIISEL